MASSIANRDTRNEGQGCATEPMENAYAVGAVLLEAKFCQMELTDRSIDTTRMLAYM